MTAFKDLASFALHLAAQEVAVLEGLHVGLEQVATRIEKTARDEIGEYQPAAGGFPAWPALADSSEERKAAMGFPAGAPLLATGDMRESISHSVEGLDALIGSPDEKLVFHEFGTSRMPARPVLGPAAFNNKATIQKLVGAALVAGFVGAERVHSALGYDMETKD